VGERKEGRLARARRQKQEYETAWNAFPALPGLHLRARTTRRLLTLETASGTPLAMVRIKPFSLRYPLRRIEIVNGPTYTVIRRGLRIRIEFVDMATNQLVLILTGNHLNNRANTRYELPLEVRSIQFPVHGTSRSNATMHAIDSASHDSLAQYRHLDKHTIEIVVSPNTQPIAENLLILATSAPLIRWFFVTTGGG
jgi:hypothetical protein